MVTAFDHIERTAAGHFRLKLHAAAYAIVHALRRTGGDGEDGLLAQMILRHPFLAGYVAEILPHMPDTLGWDEAPAWWAAEITAWEEGCNVPPPLLLLAKAGSIGPAAQLALMVSALAEEDARFGAFFAELQAPVAGRRPSIGLLGTLLAGGLGEPEADGWALCRDMLAQGLVEATDTDRPRAEWTLRLPPPVWAMLRGEAAQEALPGYRLLPPQDFAALDKLIFDPGMRQRLERLPALLAEGKLSAIVIRAMPGGDALETMGALARASGLGLVLASPAPPNPDAPALLGPLCVMAQAMPVFAYDLGPGETARLPALAGYTGPVGVLLGQEGGVAGSLAETAMTISLPLPVEQERRRCWRIELGDRPADLGALAERFILPQGHIRQAARKALSQAAIDGRSVVALADVQAACRSLNRQLLDTHAARLDVSGGWDDLVVNGATRVRLHDLARRCRHRERLLAHLGQGFAGANRGVRALFSGASGTGKTLAAKVLAVELGMDLYRVDLGSVVNKYIGETEKNLHQVLSRAEALDVILLLDEGDALLGNRTEVKSANDRYANLETNYLLQRLETYQGIVIVTTNAAQNIDRAFQRRMDVVVPFVYPQADERRAIWRLHLPTTHTIEPAYLEQIVQRCRLTGGQIRNAALDATLLAVADGPAGLRPLHLETAVRGEYRKAGATCPLDGEERGTVHRGMSAFLEVMRS